MLMRVDMIRLLIRERWNDNQQPIKVALQTQPEVEIVGEVAEHVELLVAVRETNADAVLLVIDADEDEGMLSHLFAEYPDLTVLAVPAGNSATQPAYQLSDKHPIFIEQRCRYRCPLDDAAPGSIVQALCRAVREPFDLINVNNHRH